VTAVGHKTNPIETVAEPDEACKVMTRLGRVLRTRPKGFVYDACLWNVSVVIGDAAVFEQESSCAPARHLIVPRIHKRGWDKPHLG